MSSVSASVVLLTYNQEAFVQDALQSLLDQDFDDLEIVVSDDCSQDKTWKLINDLAEKYKGPKSILLSRNFQNIGLVANYTKAFSLTTGEFIFTAAGDDVSLPTRCSSCIDFWETHDSKPDLVAADGFDMDLDGIVLGLKKTDNLEAWDLTRWSHERPFIFGASHMMTRRLIELNDLNTNLSYEDQCFFFRSLLMNGAVRLDQPLVKHRRGGVSQRNKDYVYEVKRKKMIDSSVNGIDECNQMLSDAALCGVKDQQVLLAIRNKIQSSEFAYKILSESNFWKKCLLMHRAQGVSLAKRFRYFQFAVFPWIHCSLMRLKQLLRVKNQ